MIRVVIADDEIKVCQLICGIIDWKSVDMDIIGVAHNGIEALELIKTLQPDLMITDIRMPGCDGLEMIAKGKQLKKDLDFIIISGYNHFEYAQSAIKYGVSDYLLKPIKKNELLDTLNKMGEKYRLRSEQLSNEEQLKIRLQSDIDKLRAGFFSEILLPGSGKQEELNIDNINRNFHFKFQRGYFQIFIIKVDCEFENLYSSSIKILEDKLGQIFRGLLKTECYDMEFCFQGSRIYFILNYSENNKKAVRKQLKAGLDEMLMQRSIFGSMELTLGLGTSALDINGLRNSHNEAEASIYQRLIIGTGRLIEDVPILDTLIDNDELLSGLSKKMERAIEILDPNGVIMLIDSLKNEVMSKPNKSGQGVINLVKNICSIYIMLLRNYKFSMEEAEQFYEVFCIHADICSSISQLFTYASRAIGESINKITEDRRQEDTRPIRLAKQYIQKNYMKPITLKEVSLVAGFNDTYFSSLFKKESGLNFLEYLSEIRMNKAKELLRESNYSVADICERVGYMDLKHFTKSFKKYTGLNPNEFRKLYS